MIRVILKSKISRRVENGHPWIFANEVETIQGTCEGGEVVEVLTFDKKYLGTGFVNPRSQILVRLLTRNRDEVINGDFFIRRIREAKEYKNRIGYRENCRVIFGEADYMPGLIIDKFNDYFVIQTLALGIDRWKPEIVKALQTVFEPKGIYERNDVPVRELEGMQQQKGFLSDPFDTSIIIRENGLQFYVDIENGQKTGYFLDQQDNRRKIRHVVKDAEVLEVFCYTGSFSNHAGFYGARKVLGMDISANAVNLARKNAALNGLENICSFEAMNAFDVLKPWAKEKVQFDVVILDPPAFTKSRENIQKAITGYKEINLRSIKLVKPGGFLVTASCTNLVPPETFLEVVDAAAKDARRKLRNVTFQTQSGDHPVIRGIENTGYLKFLIVEVQ
jgi:23S rRNA (cytosine1962-C5)-methyltransferase